MTYDYDLLIRGVLPYNENRPIDLGVRGGKIVSLGEKVTGEGEQEIEGKGRVIIPGFVDAHMHLDKAWLGDSTKWDCVTLQDMIQATRSYVESKGWRKGEILERALRGAKLAAGKGTTALRTHVDLREITGTEGIEALIELRDVVKPWLDIQVVAFCLDGFTGASDGGEALLRQAMDLGANIVGGNLDVDENPEPFLDMLFQVAKEQKVEIDLHVDESNDPTLLRVEPFAEKTIENNWEGKVTGSHVCALYWAPEDEVVKVIDKMVKSQMKVVTNPMTNLYIRGPNPRLPTGPTRTKELIDAGIKVSIGTDNTRDFFAPMGNADMLFATNLLAHQRRFTSRPVIETALEMATITGAENLGLCPPYGLQVGCSADLVILDAQEINKAVIDLSPRLFVVKRGKIIYEKGNFIPIDE